MRLVFVLNESHTSKFFCALFRLHKLNRAIPLLFFWIISFGYSQSEPVKKYGSNEIKLNTLYLPGGYPELSYERILGNNSAVGLSAGFLINSAGPNYATDIITFDKAIFPYYRYYFGQRRAAGFFVEGNTIVYSRESVSQEDKETGWGIGLAAGIKIIIKDNWNVDLMAGGGVNINKGNSNPSGYLDFPDMYPRLGLSIGKRF